MSARGGTETETETETESKTDKKTKMTNWQSDKPEKRRLRNTRYQKKKAHSPPRPTSATLAAAGRPHRSLRRVAGTDELAWGQRRRKKERQGWKWCKGWKERNAGVAVHSFPLLLPDPAVSRLRIASPPCSLFPQGPLRIFPHADGGFCLRRIPYL